MSLSQTAYIIDSDVRRRGTISYCLVNTGLHVEPFESADDLLSHSPKSGFLLVHDQGSTIKALVACISESGHWLPVIGFAEKPTPLMVVRAVQDGAIDYISWPCNGGQVLEAILRAETTARRLRNVRLREVLARGQVGRLTRREREVLSGIASGLSNRAIGGKLAISPRTVEIHRANMLTKMGARHTSEAIRIAIEANI